MSAQRRYRGWVSLWSTVCAAWLLFPFFANNGTRHGDTVNAVSCMVSFVPVFIVWLAGYVVLAIGYLFARDADREKPTTRVPSPPWPTQGARRARWLWPLIAVVGVASAALAVMHPDKAKQVRDYLRDIVSPAQPK